MEKKKEEYDEVCGGVTHVTLDDVLGRSKKKENG